MKIKILSTDFDGTLLNSDKKITEKSKQGLLKLKEKGITIVGITERILATVKNDIDTSLFDYIILNNGANLYNPKTNKIEYNNYIEKETAEEITTKLNQITNKISFATYNKYYNFPNYKNGSNKPYVVEINNINEIKDPISRININIEKEELEYSKKELQSIDNINLYTSQDSFSDIQKLTILPNNINKKIALEKLSTKLNIKMEEIIFFGDGLNDLELINSNCITVAMGNALNIIKEKAKYITTSNNEDGVISFMEKITKEIGEANGTH